MRLLLLLFTGPASILFIPFIALMLFKASEINSLSGVFIYGLIGLCFFGPLILPRIFIWPSISLNLCVIITLLAMLRNDFHALSGTVTFRVLSIFEHQMPTIIALIFCVLSILLLLPAAHAIIFKVKEARV